MKIKTMSRPTTSSISMARGVMRLLEKATRIFGKLHDEFGLNGKAAERRTNQQRKMDRQNRINENRMNEEEELRRFVDENLENELRELAKVDRVYIDSRDWN